MLNQDTKVFRDNVHGYIKIPVDYVTNFIDTDIFQRLRFIEQTGMRTLYPSARHDRFIHSLGVYFLGHKAFKNFRYNIKLSYDDELYNIYGESDDKNDKFWDKCQLLFEIACLLHDCGHSPFSHTLEFHYNEIYFGDKKDNISVKDKLKTYLQSPDFLADFQDQGKPHERMSALIVCSEFKDKIDNLIRNHHLDDIDIGNPTEFITRMIIGCEYNNIGNNTINQIKNCIISLLNSKSIDVDSLDYIVRDAKLSGIDNVSIDLDRLLGSLTLIKKTQFKNARFNDATINHVIIDGILETNNSDQNFKLSGRFKGHMDLYNLSGGRLTDYVHMSGKSIHIPESVVGTLITQKNRGPNCFLTINNTPYTSFPCGLDTADTMELSDNVCEFPISSNSNEAVTFHELTDIHAENLSAKKICFKHTYVEAKGIFGQFTGTLLGASDYLKKLGGELKIELGYHKSSLSVIQNVIIARNYEYQWIYSHHKVVYYSNYLIRDLLRNCISHLLEKYPDPSNPIDSDDAIHRILSTVVNFDSQKIPCEEICNGAYKFSRPTDSDIVALFKICQLNCTEGSLLYNLLKEYYTRNYKKSLWKSYAEFNIFFSGFTDRDKENILKNLQNTKNTSAYTLTGEYDYLRDELESGFNNCGLKNVVWVNGRVNLKSLTPDETYILFKDDIVLTYKETDPHNYTNVESNNFFYIYYDPNGSVEKDRLKDYFKKLSVENPINTPSSK